VESLWTLFVALVLASWILASVVHQFRPRWWSRVIRYDTLNLLPIWTFFAPNPGRDDLFVVYREFDLDGARGPWHQLAVGDVDRRVRWIWQPVRYPRKAVRDLAQGLLQMVHDTGDEPRMVLLSGPYLSLLQWVMAQPDTTAGVTARQFALIATQGCGEGRGLEIRYISEVHRAAA